MTRSGCPHPRTCVILTREVSPTVCLGGCHDPLCPCRHRARRTLMNRCVEVTTTRREHGDVPGWVFITIMTAAIAMAIWTLLGTTTMVKTAINSVTAP